MSRKVVIVGIGTGVGKTLVSAIVCKALCAAYWKPVQTGYLSGKGDRDADEVQKLSACQVYPEAYLFEEPLSPHAAAAIDGKRVDVQQIKVPQHDGNLVVEGAGGLMVPLNEEVLYIDLLAQWQFPVILVVRHYLGNINHTLLSVEALKKRNIPILGLIMSGNPLPETVSAIQHFSGQPVLLHIPELDEVNEEVVEVLAEELKEKLGKMLI
jgi:dethiobiotin synthase